MAVRTARRLTLSLPAAGLLLVLVGLPASPASAEARPAAPAKANLASASAPASGPAPAGAKAPKPKPDRGSDQAQASRQAERPPAHAPARGRRGTAPPPHANAQRPAHAGIPGPPAHAQGGNDAGDKGGASAPSTVTPPEDTSPSTGGDPAGNDAPTGGDAASGGGSAGTAPGGTGGVTSGDRAAPAVMPLTDSPGARAAVRLGSVLPGGPGAVFLSTAFGAMPTSGDGVAIAPVAADLSTLVSAASAAADLSALAELRALVAELGRTLDRAAELVAGRPGNPIRDLGISALLLALLAAYLAVHRRLDRGGLPMRDPQRAAAGGDGVRLVL